MAFGTDIERLDRLTRICLGKIRGYIVQERICIDHLSACARTGITGARATGNIFELLKIEFFVIKYFHGFILLFILRQL
jgi:hypothetical protein